MYTAICARITVREHHDKKYTKIQIGRVCNEDVIVGKDIVDGEIGVFFPAGGQLSEEFAKTNNLMHSQGGYLEDNRRIKAIKLCGIKSAGIFCKLDAFSSPLKEGDQFTELDGKQICNRYETRATRALKDSSGKPKKIKKGETKYFPKHYDTKQFKYSMQEIPLGAVCYITEKVHGTSQRTGLVFVESDIELPWWKRLVNRLYCHEVYPTVSRDFVLMNGTRNCLLWEGKENYRDMIIADWKHRINKGENVFFEVVGYTDSGAAIQGPVGTKSLKDKAFSKRYGDSMPFSYGCVQGHCEAYVYRITQTGQDGVIRELSFPQIRQRCKELGVKCVPQLDCFIFDGDYDKLIAHLDSLIVGDSTLDSRHIREGVVIRAESENGTVVLKHKSWEFLVLEGVVKNNEEYVDIEEAS